jgi:hypothetical protein
MASRLIVPFDNNPASTSVKTSSYTVPVGKYAKVSTLSAFFSIDSVQIYPTGSASVSAPTGTNTTITRPITPGAYIFSATFTRGGGGSNANSGSYGFGSFETQVVTTSSASRTTNGTSQLLTGYSEAPAIWLSATAGINGTAATAVSWYFVPVGAATTFWVKTGTVLNGNSYVVEEYNAIS